MWGRSEDGAGLREPRAPGNMCTMNRMSVHHRALTSLSTKGNLELLVHIKHVNGLFWRTWRKSMHSLGRNPSQNPKIAKQLCYEPLRCHNHQTGKMTINDKLQAPVSPSHDKRQSHTSPTFFIYFKQTTK